MKYSTETVLKIWDDETGDHWEVCEDGDGLGMLEIRCVAGGKIHSRVSMPAELALTLAGAIQRWVDNRECKS